MKEMVGGCCVCSDERGWDENPLVYCDGHGCNVAVHQACYGIVDVPSGPWYCRKCESQERAARVQCELCPQKDGALKRTDSGGWCHVLCALYIPEAWFANVDTMEPIVLKSVPPERFNKVCYICEESKKDITKNVTGACMQCNKNGCRQFFHVTCAQAHGLLCEESGNSGDNVKYCGYCAYHYKKLKKDANIKIIPAFRPIPADSATPDSTPEKGVNGPPKLEKERRVSRVSSGSKISGDGSDDRPRGRASHPCKPRPVFMPFLSVSSINSDSSHASCELPDAESKKSASGITGRESESPASQDSSSVTNGVSGSVTANSNCPRSHSSSSINVENLTLSSSSSSNNGEGRGANESAFPLSENLFAPLCSSSHANGSNSSSSNSVMFGNVSLSSNLTNTSQVNSSGFENYFANSNNSSSGIGAASSVGAGGLGSLLSTPVLTPQPSLVTPQPSLLTLQPSLLTTQPSITTQPSLLTTQPTVLGLVEATVAKRQRSNSRSKETRKGKKTQKPSSEVKTAKSKSRGGGGGNGGGAGATSSNGKSTKKDGQGLELPGSALGHHNYASSVFGGSPCFQSPVPLASFSCPDGEMVNCTSAVVLPPKIFPSLHSSRLHDSNGRLQVSLEELLEQQWDQSARFLIEQSQQFDVATLLNQMHRLKSDNAVLEEHVRQLKSHRDHLLATNARLAVPFPSSVSEGEPGTHEAIVQNKTQLSDLSVQPPQYQGAEAISSPVEPFNLHGSSLPLRMPDPLNYGQSAAIARASTPPDAAAHNPQVMHSNLHPPPARILLPGFQQLPPTAGAKAVESKHPDTDKT